MSISKIIAGTWKASVAAIGSFVLWTVWLALGLLLVLQLYVAGKNELALPDFLRARFERQLADAGIRATFARTSFDPTGRVLVEGASFSLPEYPEPVIVARAVYAQLDPWALIVGRVEPREIRITGASAAVPAMLSPSGRAEEIVRDLDVTLAFAGKQVGITQLSARLAGITLVARGALQFVPAAKPKPEESLAERISTRFPVLCREATALTAQLEALEAPRLTLELEPSDTHGAIVAAELVARSFALATPVVATIHDFQIRTQLPLFGETPTVSRLELVAAELRLPLEAEARGVRAVISGRFRPGGLQFDPHEVQISADRVAASGFFATAVSAELAPQPLPKLSATLVADVMGGALAVRANADFAEHSATLRFDGTVSPQLLDPIGARLHVDVKQYFNFAALDCTGGEARLAPGWKFEKLTARATLQEIQAYHVTMEEGRATIELAPGRFYSPDAYARIGANFARGSYEQDLHTHRYRFLLDGRLRPLDIAGWFHDWWPNFFHQLEFPAAPPLASVDVSGVWRDGRQSAVFVFADTEKPVIRGAEFDRVRTRLFIRPAFFDGHEIFAARGDGAARGTFAYLADPATHAWRTLELKLDSTLDLALAAKIVGAPGEKLFNTFQFAQPPAVKFDGTFDGPAAPGGAHQTLQLEVHSRGEFRFHGFPLEDTSFRASVRDAEIVVDPLDTRFAGGVASGRAKVWGPGADRRVGFDLALKDASLGQAAAALQRYTAEQNHRPVASPGKFVQEKANVRIDLAASAEGSYASALSFQGTGNATLTGAEIGEVPLLGSLSELLKFTALRFTSARANFRLAGPRLEFTEVALRGANSAIDAHGDYALDRHELDFKAKIFPFQESGNLIKSVVGAVLSPISNVFEVKLSGSLEKPQWAFVIGPTNLIHSLAPGEIEPAKSEPATPEVAPPTAAPAPPVESAAETTPAAKT
ncbi:MAG TPA: AsmA-like C-terminal region-containing protein [Opitutaceae bacterium]|nr:AsmA-like C-terminal region-containing protein [Opitutaceae bacterium]